MRWYIPSYVSVLQALIQVARGTFKSCGTRWICLWRSVCPFCKMTPDVRTCVAASCTALDPEACAITMGRFWRSLRLLVSSKDGNLSMKSGRIWTQSPNSQAVCDIFTPALQAFQWGFSCHFDEPNVSQRGGAGQSSQHTATWAAKSYDVALSHSVTVYICGMYMMYIWCICTHRYWINI